MIFKADEQSLYIMRMASVQAGCLPRRAQNHLPKNLHSMTSAIFINFSWRSSILPQSKDMNYCLFFFFFFLHPHPVCCIYGPQMLLAAFRSGFKCSASKCLQAWLTSVYCGITDLQFKDVFGIQTLPPNNALNV